MTGTHNRLAAFILLSLGAHALLLVPGVGKRLTATVTPSLGTLSVSLQAMPAKHAHDKGKPIVKRLARVPDASPSSMTHSTSGKHPDMARSGGQSAPPSHATNRVRRELLARLQTQFEYPLMAVRHGWQGDVQLSFRILANGTLTNIQVARSSGYALLDRSAMEALRRVHRLDGSEHWLQGQQLDMTVPIRYQLKEG